MKAPLHVIGATGTCTALARQNGHYGGQWTKKLRVRYSNYSDEIASGRPEYEMALDGEVLTFKLPSRTVGWSYTARDCTVEDALIVFFDANGIQDVIIENVEDHRWPRCPLSDEHPLFAEPSANWHWWTCTTHGISAPVGRLEELYLRHPPLTAE